MPDYDEELSIEAQTALSYLEDIEKSRGRLDPDENFLICEQEGQQLLAGDMVLAWNEAEKAQDQGESQMIRGMCRFEEGMIYLEMARGFARVVGADSKYRRKRDEYTAKAGQAFQSAIDFNPRQVYYFNLGVICNIMERKHEAIQMFQKAQEGDDRQIATDARKEIGRIGPVQHPPVSSFIEKSPASESSQSAVRFERKQTVDVKTIAWGAVITVIGVPMMGFAIGFLMIPAGLIMMIKGALTKVDV